MLGFGRKAAVVLGREATERVTESLGQIWTNLALDVHGRHQTSRVRKRPKYPADTPAGRTLLGSTSPSPQGEFA